MVNGAPRTPVENIKLYESSLVEDILIGDASSGFKQRSVEHLLDMVSNVKYVAGNWEYSYLCKKSVQWSIYLSWCFNVSKNVEVLHPDKMNVGRI